MTTYGGISPELGSGSQGHSSSDGATPSVESLPSPWLQDADVTLYHGDVLSVLPKLPAESGDCVVTSPPYWGLRDYGTPGQLGLEPTPEQYVERMVEVFREVRRVLAPHGTVWLNLGDSYAAANNRNDGTRQVGSQPDSERDSSLQFNQGTYRKIVGLKPKDLVGIPWRVAFALQADGWYLRSDIVWSKPNPMPESVTDRPTKAHEYVFLLSKQPRYFFDQEAVREAHTDKLGIERFQGGNGVSRPEYEARTQGWNEGGMKHRHRDYNPAGRNIRSVWEIATQPYPEAHFATFPEELARRCIAAGCPEQVCRVCGKARERVVERVGVRDLADEAGSRVQGGDKFAGRREQGLMSARSGLSVSNSHHEGTPQSPQITTLGFTDCGHSDYRPGIVLDPFMGSGTVAHVARKLGRHSVGIDLNEDYLELAARRLQQQSLFAEAL